MGASGWETASQSEIGGGVGEVRAERQGGGEGGEDEVEVM